MVYTIILSLLSTILPVQNNSQIAFNTEQQPDVEAVLNKGLEAEAAGDYERALKIWLEAKPSLEVPNLIIGQNYIRVAAAHNLKSYYKAASVMYYWGLNGETLAPNHEALKTELTFMDPLLEKNTRKQWKKLLEENDPTLYKKIRGWWDAVDPAPGTLTNERLIEHWQRIAYARENFTRADNTPYGTDERGTAWVAYGKPDRTFIENLQLSKFEAKRIAEKFKAGVAADAIANAAISMQNSPRLTIWIYLDGISKLRENLVLIFGPKASGGYGEIEVVENLIPNQGFTQSNRYSKFSLQLAQAGVNPVIESRINPGMVLQWHYYRQLSNLSAYFSNIFAEMASDWETAKDSPPRNPALKKYFGSLYKGKHIQQKIVIRAKAPKQASTLEKDFPQVPLTAYQYALLDARNQPVFATFLVSRPQHAFLTDLATNEDVMMASTSDSIALQEAFSYYQLVHGITLRGPDGAQLGTNRHTALLQVNGDDIDTQSSSGFMIPYKEGIAQQFYAELRNSHPNTQSVLDKNRPEVGSPFPKAVRGVGTLTVNQPEPLKSTPNTLQLGEPILGWDIDANPDGLVPFRVVHDGQIPKGEPLALHFEVYDLQQGTEGIYGFDLNYSILPVNPLGWTQERKDELSITINFEHVAPRFTENLEIKSASLEPGRYVLRLNTTDKNNGKQAYREVEFKVVEKK